MIFIHIRYLYNLMITFSFTKENGRDKMKSKTIYDCILCRRLDCKIYHSNELYRTRLAEA